MPLADLRFIYSCLPTFLKGLQLTCEISIISLLIAIVWGLVLVFPRRSRIRLFNLPATAYIEFLRNTPLLVQIYFIYFGLPLIGIKFSAFVCGVLGLSLQHGAFLAEIYRAGIDSISRTQIEAAKALGMKRWLTMRLVILPQALVKVIPPVGNQLVILVKDSSLLASIAVLEITLTGLILAERSAAPFEIFVTIGIFYLTLTTLLSTFLRFLEKSLKIHY